MCQQRKSELLYFLSVINAGVNLPHAAGMCSCVIAQGACSGLGCQSWGWQFSLLILLQRGLLRKHFLIWAICTSHGTWPFSSKTSWCLCLTGAGAAVHYLGKVVPLRKPCWKLFCMGKLSAILFFSFLEIIQSMEGEAPRRRWLEGKRIWFCNNPGVLSGKGKNPLPKMGEEELQKNGLKLPLSHL